MPLADYYDMVKAFPPQRANHSLRIGVLPWRAWQQPRLTRKSFAIDLEALTTRPPRVRYEWPRPGQLLHLDIKKLGRIGHVGHRITGDRHGQARGIGWEFAHVCIDDCSRVA